MISANDIRQAAQRIRLHTHVTPVLTSERLDEITGSKLYFKCENLQKAGAFKSRGAVNAVFSLQQDQAANGVATHSSGNHGAALARAAQIRGIPAYIVVPDNANAVKKNAIEAYGATLIECEPTLPAREQKLQQVIAETGAQLIHPYDSNQVIAGQGTATLELLQQVPELDMVVTPVGGGGLLAGSAVVGKEADVQLFGAEPEQADDAYRSFTTGVRVTEHVPRTICDGLLTTLGEKNFAIIRDNVTGILLASEQEIVTAMTLLWTRLKQVVEPSSSVAFAVVQRHPEIFRDKKVGVILTGGNVDVLALPFST